jgi:hypothetical protein
MIKTPGKRVASESEAQRLAIRNPGKRYVVRTRTGDLTYCDPVQPTIEATMRRAGLAVVQDKCGLRIIKQP